MLVAVSLRWRARFLPPSAAASIASSDELVGHQAEALLDVLVDVI
jgi:hypothetical protein